jgi:hypothetical protein
MANMNFGLDFKIARMLESILTLGQYMISTALRQRPTKDIKGL